MDEYWKRLVDTERKCEFNTITPEDIITCEFAESINDKKARDKFIKGSLKLQLILETIELDNYNRKHGDKQSKTKKQRSNSSESTCEDEQVRYTKPATEKKATFTGKKKLPRETAISAERSIGHPNIYAQHGKLNATIAKSWELCQSLPNQSRKPGTGRRYRQQYGVLDRNRSYLIRQRHKLCRFLQSNPIGGVTTNRIHH